MRCGDGGGVGGFFWGRYPPGNDHISPPKMAFGRWFSELPKVGYVNPLRVDFRKKWGCLKMSQKKQMWTKKPLGDVWYVFVWQIFWGGYGIWNRFFSPISYSSRWRHWIDLPWNLTTPNCTPLKIKILSPRMELWKIMFLFNWAVSFQGCIWADFSSTGQDQKKQLEQNNYV